MQHVKDSLTTRDKYTRTKKRRRVTHFQAFCFIVSAYQDLELEKPTYFNEISIWIPPTQFSMQKAANAQQRKMHLMSQMSYCLSVSLIWSDDGQLPFWAAKSRNILAARLAANKARWNSLARVSPFTPSPFIYKSQYCYYEDIIGVLRFTYLFPCPPS